jgi:uncharacterized protein YoxC
MASAEEYAAWIVKNADKKGTPEFETVANAYREVKAAGMYGSDNSDQVSRKVSSADMAASREDQSPGGQMKAALDVLTSLGRGMVAKPAGDVAGLGSMLLSVGARGFTNEPTPWDKPQDIKESVQRAVAGDGPQTESGKYVMNIISKPGEWLDKGGQWAEDKIAPAGPDTPEDSPSRMVARAVHESINQAPMALGVAAPKLAGMAGGAMRESAINTMLKSMKPSQEDLKSGAARAAAETMVDRRLYNTPGGMDKTRALADGINRDVSQITAMSDNTADVSAMGPNIKQVIDQYAAKISESNEADKNAILAVWTSFLKNPMVNELTAPIAKRLYNAQQQLAKLKEEHAAATEHVSTAPAVDMSAPPSKPSTTATSIRCPACRVCRRAWHRWVAPMNSIRCRACLACRACCPTPLTRPQATPLTWRPPAPSNRRHWRSRATPSPGTTRRSRCSKRRSVTCRGNSTT